MDILASLKQDPAIGGTAKALADICGISKQAVSKWKRVPAEHCLAIERATDGRWSRYRLRADVFGKSDLKLAG